MNCYVELFLQIQNDFELRDQIIEIRNSMKKGKFDPITVKQDFRLIGVNELKDILEPNWKVDCMDKLEEENDFRGIRLFDKNLIIIEIDNFDRYSITEQYSKGKTIEIHRLIMANRFFNKSDFYFPTENVIWQDTITNDLIYEVTQIKI